MTNATTTAQSNQVDRQPRGLQVNSLRTMAALTALAALTLTACGGGGGGGGGSSTPAPPSNLAQTPAPAPAPAVKDSIPLQTSVPSTTYAVGSQELAAFNYLNQERARCGFGMVKQDTRLDQAAVGHSRYQLINKAQGHFQDPKLQGFTGASPNDRMMAAGYPSQYYAREVIFSVPATSPSAGVDAVKMLLSATYHSLVLISEVFDFGAGSVTNINGQNNTGFQYFTIETGISDYSYGQWDQGKGVVKSYPCDGTDLTFAIHAAETPDPYQGANTGVHRGHPIMLVGDRNTTMTITSSKVVEILPNGGIGAEVPIYKNMTIANDPNSTIYRPWHGVVLMSGAYSKGATYRATITGTNGSAPFTKTITFTVNANALVKGSEMQ